MTHDYRALSFWLDEVPGSLDPRPALDGDEVVDVVIVGAGYTGMWTAYYLQRLQPGIRLARRFASTPRRKTSNDSPAWEWTGRTLTP